MKQQILLIHGGETFKTHEAYISFLENYVIDFDKLVNDDSVGWKQNLKKDLGESFEVVAPRMPGNKNAKYDEWVLWFEKFLPHLHDDVICVGHSLGGIFLAKYISENDFPVKIRATYLVAAVTPGHPVGSFMIDHDLKKFDKQGGEIVIYHSTDDHIVPFSSSDKYKKELPNAEQKTFSNRAHFFDEHIPELIEDIKKISNID